MSDWLNFHIIQLILLLYILIWIIANIQIKNKIDIFSPWIITNFVWSAILLFFIFFDDILHPLKDQFYTCLFLWITTFNISSIFTYKATKSFYGIYYFKSTIFKILFIITIILTPIYLYFIYKSLGGNFTNIAYNIRTLANSGNLDVGNLVYIRSLASALMIISLWRWNYTKKFIPISLILINIIMGLSIMEKGSFFTILIAILYIFYCHNKISLKKIAIYLTSFLLLSFLFNLSRHKDSSTEISFFEFFSCYIMSPCVAFETLEECSSEYFGASTFPFFYKLLNALHLTNIETISKVKDFVFVPIRTNVYTVFAQYFVDFGYFGVAFFGIINGAINGYIYKKCNTGSTLMKCFYTYLLTLLILQFFQENFFVSMSVVIQYLIVFSFIYSTHNQSQQIKL